MFTRQGAEDEGSGAATAGGGGVWRKRLRGSAVRRSAAKQGAMVARDGFVDLGTPAPPASASKFERIELRLDLGGKLMLHRMRRTQGAGASTNSRGRQRSALRQHATGAQ